MRTRGPKSKRVNEGTIGHEGNRAITVLKANTDLLMKARASKRA